MVSWMQMGFTIGTILTIILLSIGEPKPDPTILDYLWFYSFTFGTPLLSAYLAFREKGD